MRRALIALAAAFALLAPARAVATSIADAPPHDPVLACAAIGEVVANLNAGQMEDWKVYPGPTFYSDALGEVGVEEEEAFLHALRHSEGKPDRKPIRLHSVSIVHRDKYRPTWLVVLEREAWRETRIEMDSMLELHEIPDPHYEVDRSHWLVTFQSNHIEDFRETPELDELADKARKLRSCVR